MRHLLLMALAAAAPALAQPMVLRLDAAHSTVNFTLAATLHTVHGCFQVKHGEIRYDPATGQIGGEVVVDAASGASGEAGRDRRMHKVVLESGRYPEIVFTPDRVEGAVARSGVSQVQVHGVFRIHGAEHEITIPVEVRMNGGKVAATAHFTIPYAEWGMRNPSNLFLHVGDTVEIDAAVSALP